MMSKAKRTLEERLAEKRERMAKLQAQVSQMTTQMTRRKHIEDTRRKVLVGVVVLGRASKHPKIAEWLRGVLDADLTEERDRLLFPELSATKVSSAVPAGIDGAPQAQG